jgi:hypothetical protein
MGVECAWPVREVVTIDRQSVQLPLGKLRRHAWRAVAVAVVVALLTFGGWTLKDSAIDIATVLPSSVPTQIE